MLHLFKNRCRLTARQFAGLEIEGTENLQITVVVILRV